MASKAKPPSDAAIAATRVSRQERIGDRQRDVPLDRRRRHRETTSTCSSPRPASIVSRPVSYLGVARPGARRTAYDAGSPHATLANRRPTPPRSQLVFQPNTRTNVGMQTRSTYRAGVSGRLISETPTARSERRGSGDIFRSVFNARPAGDRQPAQCPGTLRYDTDTGPIGRSGVFDSSGGYGRPMTLQLMCLAAGGPRRRAPPDPLMVAYHDTEWGVPVRGDRELFERLALEGSGRACRGRRSCGSAKRSGPRSQGSSRRSWPFDEADRERLLETRHRPQWAKIDATIGNARAFAGHHRRVRIVRRLPRVDGARIAAASSPVAGRARIPDRTPVADALSKDLNGVAFQVRRAHDRVRLHAERRSGRRPPTWLLRYRGPGRDTIAVTGARHAAHHGHVRMRLVRRRDGAREPRRGSRRVPELRRLGRDRRTPPRPRPHVA